MPDSDESLERRLAAVERSLDADPRRERPDQQPDGDDGLGARVATLESRVDELDAAVQSIRGFLGGVAAVNEEVERRADSAVAAVDRLERRLDDNDDELEGFGQQADDDAHGEVTHDDAATDADDNDTRDNPHDGENPTEPSTSGEVENQGLRERLQRLR
ncbi:MAG: DUF7310 family coiled-coil domain-containing protein [Halolamina sp.]